MDKNHIIFKVITIVVVVITLFLAGWIMANQLGIVEGYDFGAGAYYYADIPTEQYQQIDKEGAYQTSVPKWIFYVLFLAWGWLMWRLWVRAENGKRRTENGKRRTENGERRTENGKRRIES